MRDIQQLFYLSLSKLLTRSFSSCSDSASSVSFSRLSILSMGSNFAIRADEEDGFEPDEYFACLESKSPSPRRAVMGLRTISQYRPTENQ